MFFSWIHAVSTPPHHQTHTAKSSNNIILNQIKRNN